MERGEGRRKRKWDGNRGEEMRWGSKREGKCKVQRKGNE